MNMLHRGRMGREWLHRRTWYCYGNPVLVFEPFRRWPAPAPGRVLGQEKEAATEHSLVAWLHPWYWIYSLLEAHALPRASGPRQRTRNPRQRLCRGLPSAKTPRGIFRRRRGLCRGPFIGHSAKPLPRARIALGKEKTPSDAGAVGGFFAEGRPSAKKWFFF